ncbi:MAG: malonyl CoA-acyl carrier protein transacylase/acyl carrier protein, partial [Kiritimatiellia bacterium]
LAAEEHLFLIGAANDAALLHALTEARSEATAAPTLAHAAHRVAGRWQPGARVIGFVVGDARALAAAFDVASRLVQTGTPGVHDGVRYAHPTATQASLAVVFPGQGSQYVHMARTAALRHPPLLSAIDRAQSAMRRAAGGSLACRLYPSPAWTDDDKAEQAAALTATEWAQPALGAVDKGYWDVLYSYGVRASAFAGHSYGELVALCAAGAYDEDTLHTLSRVRGQAMRADPGVDRGTMAAISGELHAIRAVVDTVDDVVLANLNHPTQGVISGTRDGVRLALRALEDAGLRGREIPVSAAFHSPLVADAREPLAQALREANVSATTVPVFANKTAAAYPANPDAMRELLADQIVSSVDFVGVVQAMLDAGARTFVECGPKGVLAGLLRRCLHGVDDVEIVAVDQEGARVDGDTQLKRVLLALACRGVAIDLAPMLAERLPQAPRIEGSKATVWVGGANYKKPSTLNPPLPVKPPVYVPQGAAMAAQTASRVGAPATGPTSRAAVRPTRPSYAPPTDVAGPPLLSTPPASPSLSRPRAYGPGVAAQPSGGALSSLLAATRDSLKAYQETQARTADVHAQFLRGHSQANESFTALFATHARLVELATGAGVTTTSPRPSQTPRAPSGHNTPLVLPDNSAPHIAASDELPPMLSASMLTALIKKGAALPDPVRAQTSRVEPLRTPTPRVEPAVDVCAVLLATVADKTGYPVDLLDLGMDLETDLGVDSIKRVEIVSALQEAIPQLPALDDDHLGGLRTLGEIAQYAQSTIGPAAGTEALSAVVAPVESQINMDASIDIQGIVLQVVADKTGYPTDLLNLSMDLETDLGIDSIKRVEIMAAISEVTGRSDLNDDAAADLRTLAEIVAHMTQGAASLSVSTELSTPIEVASEAVEVASEAVEVGSQLRREVIMAPAPDGRTVSLVGACVITRDALGMADGLASALRRLGVTASVVDPDWSSAESVEACLPQGIGGLVHMAAVGAVHDALQARIRGGFLLARAGSDLGLFATVSSLGGTFAHGGLSGEPLQGALAGLAKTVNQERAHTRCLALDIEPGRIDLDVLARELMTDRGVVEIGLTDEPLTPVDVTMAVNARAAVAVPVAPGDLVVVSGGGRGVTARVVVEMARRWRPSLLLLGRSVVAENDPQWAEGASDAQLKSRRIGVLRSTGAPFSPRSVEADVASVRKSREVRSTIEAARAAGCWVNYSVVDVLDADSVRAAVDAAVQACGAVRGVVHGAGVIADRLLDEKTAEQFDFVYRTKVDGLQHLLGAVDVDELNMLAVFSSVAGRYGNRGQVDYSMANEAITRVAHGLKAQGVAHVKALHWGPWAGGMVSDSLAAAFAARGMPMIELGAGAAA